VAIHHEVAENGIFAFRFFGRQWRVQEDAWKSKRSAEIAEGEFGMRRPLPSIPKKKRRGTKRQESGDDGGDNNKQRPPKAKKKLSTPKGGKTPRSKNVSTYYSGLALLKGKALEDAAKKAGHSSWAAWVTAVDDAADGVPECMFLLAFGECKKADCRRCVGRKGT